jgi:protein-tyrosine-phosphatase
MKWITREKARVDRIACPWLIGRFIDPAPTFLFVPAGRVAEEAARHDAIPYDVPGAELGHHGDRCSFDAFLTTYGLEDGALHALAAIVRGADTDARQLTPESAGLYAMATGFQRIARDDHDNMARQFPAYDALYAFCQARTTPPSAGPRVLFVCPHGAAKSVIAATHLERLAAARGLRIGAAFAATAPDPAIAPRVVTELLAEGIDLRGRRPRRVTDADLASASCIVTFGCDLAVAPTTRVERWDDVPAVSDDYRRARAAIDARLVRLVEDLAGRA